MNQIHLFDLPLVKFRVCLAKELLKELLHPLEQKYGSHSKIATHFGLKKGEYLRRYFVTNRSGIPLKLLKEICDELQISQSKIEKNVIGLKTIKSKDEIKNPKLPFKILTEEMGLVVGGVLGDGGIDKNKHRVIYCNSEHEQIDSFVSNAKKVFGEIRISNHRSTAGIPIIILPKACGIILEKIGLIACNKNFEEKVCIPEIFVKHPNHQSTKYLLKRLMDDDGTVVNNHFCRNVSLVDPKISKEKKLESKLLLTTKEILQKSGISSKIMLNKITSKENGEKTYYWRLIICGKQNLQLYYEKIGFGLERKQLKLKKTLERYIDGLEFYPRFQAAKYYLEKIQKLTESGINVTANILAKSCSRNSRHIREVLFQLNEQKLVKRDLIGRTYFYRVG